MGVVIFVTAMAFILEYQRRRNISSIESFNKQSIKSVIKKVRKGSGGFYSLTTVDEKTFNFCPRDSFFESHVSPGDSILKPAYDDTIRIYNGSRNLKITFLK